MSYCRFSSDDWMCDVYCYEHCNGGFITHVAASRRVARPATTLDWTNGITLCATNKAQMAELGAIGSAPIGLPFDGETFNDASLENMRLRLMALKECGYNVPNFVFDRIDQEIAEGL